MTNQKFIHNQKGQGLMEYIIISGLIGVFCLVAVQNFGKTFKSKVDYMKNRIQKAIPSN